MRGQRLGANRAPERSKRFGLPCRRRMLKSRTFWNHACVTDQLPTPAPHRMDLRARYTIALVAFLATALGAVVGGGASVWAAHISADGQQRIARENFDKQQRVTAYEAEIAAAQDYVSKLVAEEVQAQFPIPKFTTEGEILTYYADAEKPTLAADAAWTKFEDATAQLQLWGSPAVRRDTMELDRLGLQMRFALIAEVGAPNVSPSHRPTRTRAFRAAVNAFSGFATNRLLVDVRSELF